MMILSRLGHLSFGRLLLKSQCSAHRYSKTLIFTFVVFTDTQHQRMLAIAECFQFVAQHLNCSCHLVYWFTSRFTEDAKLCCILKYLIKKKAVRFWSNCLAFQGFICDPPGARTQDPNIKSVVLQGIQKARLWLSFLMLPAELSNLTV